MKPQLKPCPFCGGKQPQIASVELDSTGEKGLVHFVQCTRVKCGASGPSFLQTAMEHLFDPRVQAVEGWNRRA